MVWPALVVADWRVRARARDRTLLLLRARSVRSRMVLEMLSSSDEEDNPRRTDGRGKVKVPRHGVVHHMVPLERWRHPEDHCPWPAWVFDESTEDESRI